VDDPFQHFLQKKHTWKASNRWILNCRRVSPGLSVGNLEGFGEEDDPGLGVESWYGAQGGGEWAGVGMGEWLEGPCGFIEGLLQQALSLKEDATMGRELIDFLDDTCRSRWLPLDGLTHNEQLSLFLNLYHVMLLHAYFILGPPGSSLRQAWGRCTREGY
ncbi:unnamed protein product, partial [Discosporangium mesarthrocarpum]